MSHTYQVLPNHCYLSNIIDEVRSLHEEIQDLLESSEAHDDSLYEQERIARFPEEMKFVHCIMRNADLIYSPWVVNKGRFKRLEKRIEQVIEYCGKIRETIRAGNHPFSKRFCESIAKDLAEELIEHYECGYDFKMFLDRQDVERYDAFEYDNETDTYKDDEGNVVDVEKIPVELTFDECWEGLMNNSSMDYNEKLLENQYFRKPFEEMFKSCIEDYENFAYISEPVVEALNEDTSEASLEECESKLCDIVPLRMENVWDEFYEVNGERDSLLCDYGEVDEDDSDDCDWNDTMGDTIDDVTNRLIRFASTSWKAEKPWSALEKRLQGLATYCQRIQETIRKGRHPFSEGAEQKIDLVYGLFIKWGKGEGERAFKKFLEEIHHRILIIRDYEDDKYKRASFKRTLTFRDCWKGMLRYMKYADLIDEKLLLSPRFCEAIEMRLFEEKCQQYKYIDYRSGGPDVESLGYMLIG